MKLDTVIGGLLFTVVAAVLLQRGLVSILAWLIVATFVAYKGIANSATLSVVIGIMIVAAVSAVTSKTYEGFEDEIPVEETAVTSNV
jgi:hypothetical protein